MTTENTQTAADAVAEAGLTITSSSPDGRRRREALEPRTGELVDLADASSHELARALENTGELLSQIAEFRRAIVAEVAHRVGPTSRKRDLNGVTWEVNAPTEDVYDAAKLRAGIRDLVDAGKLDADTARTVLEDVLVIPPPKQDPERVDRRRVKALLASDNLDLAGVAAAARSRIPQSRTAKPVSIVVEEE